MSYHNKCVNFYILWKWVYSFILFIKTMGSHSKWCYFHYIKVNTNITIITRTGSFKSLFKGLPRALSWWVPYGLQILQKFIWTLRTTTTYCRVSFINFYLVFPTNFRIVFLPHTNTAILLEHPVTLSQSLGYLWWK